MEKEKLEFMVFTPEIKQKIILALHTRKLQIPEKVSLVDGFINLPINMQVTSNLVIGGRTIPMITLVGTETGRLYFFSLKMILSDEGTK